MCFMCIKYLSGAAMNAIIDAIRSGGGREPVLLAF
ncbi:MAG: hypothetical protein XXXJIFNMEKO3_00780 [Candidatus Erwinia impunctatus]|nr:hypothetical protein XXXJIFNMEKO_00780 [Culicoides impunctatus]